jgi:hypothetical protein
MHGILAATWLTLALLLGAPPAGATPPPGPVVTQLPATREGTLEIDVHPGEGSDDGGTVAFGVFNSAGNDYTVELTAELYEKAPDGGKVRLTLGSVRHNLGFPVYRVTALERL